MTSQSRLASCTTLALSLLLIPACDKGGGATQAPTAGQASAEEEEATQRPELVGTWRVVAEEGKTQEQLSDELVLLAANGEALYVVGASGAYPGDGAALAGASSLMAVGFWAASGEELGMIMLTGGEQVIFDLRYTIDGDRLTMNFGDDGALSTLERLDTAPATVSFANLVQPVKTELGFGFVTAMGWKAGDIEATEEPIRVSYNLSGAGSQRLYYAVVKESAEGTARNGALNLTAGVIDKTVEQKLEYRAIENEVGCGGIQGDVVFRTQAPGFALAESVWMARDGVFYGVICTVDGSKPDHLDLVPALGSSMRVDDVAIFPDAD